MLSQEWALPHFRQVYCRSTFQAELWAETFGKFAVVIIKVNGLIGKTRYFFFKADYVSHELVVGLIIFVKHYECRKLIRFENAGHFVKGVN